MSTILVTGGAGYVGNHTVAALVRLGYDVVVVDNLSTGHRAAVPQAVTFYQTDLSDYPTLRRIFAAHTVDTVFHFAANALVGESMREPMLYLGDNVTNAANLVRAAGESKVGKFVLSSTSNLFDGSSAVPISEDHAIAPASPYGESKYVIERFLKWAETIYGMRSACLRYFNAAGSDRAGQLGEDHHPETHLIPLILDVALGNLPFIEIFGSDYPTQDGTCIRDYVHVEDLADAHIRVLEMLEIRSCAYNLGTGRGYSVAEVIETARAITGRPIAARIGPRRAGDPAVLVSDSRRICAELGWRPLFSDLVTIIETAWNWRLAHPNGYRDRQTDPHRHTLDGGDAARQSYRQAFAPGEIGPDRSQGGIKEIDLIPI